ncbi:hypothetical protein Tco_0993563 [Tanacetum coccineum]
MPPSLFGASLISATLSFRLRTLKDAACEIGIASRIRMGLGSISLSSSYSSLTYSISVPSSSLALGLGKGLRVEKPGGSVISLLLVMPEKEEERGFRLDQVLTFALVSSKTHREGCRALRGEFSYCRFDTPYPSMWDTAYWEAQYSVLDDLM